MAVGLNCGFGIAADVLMQADRSHVADLPFDPPACADGELDNVRTCTVDVDLVDVAITLLRGRTVRIDLWTRCPPRM